MTFSWFLAALLCLSFLIFAAAFGYCLAVYLGGDLTETVEHDFD
jgi:hypothetical protein